MHMPTQKNVTLDDFNANIIHCNECDRLVDFRAKIAKEK